MGFSHGLDCICDGCRGVSTVKPSATVNPVVVAGHAINGTSPENWDKVLWCIYGPNCFPTMFCCKILNHPTCGPTIWGYSVYKGEPGFRTLGQNLAKWTTSIWELYEEDVAFYDDQETALSVLRQITTPRV